MLRRFVCIIIILSVFTGTSESAMLRRGKLSPGGGSSNGYDSQGAMPRRILPKHGDIGVIVEAPDYMHQSAAEAMIIRELVNHGYRVVDEQKMKRMKMAAAKAQAARYAFEGNIAALLNVNGHYSAAATIVARVRASYPVRNPMGSLTATATVTLLAVTSRATKLGGDVAQGKSIGYTAEEAMQNAINNAVEQALSQIF